MPININTNVSAINGQKNLNRVDEDLKKPLQRLSSAKRINSARDDAAGLAIVERMTSKIRGTSAAIRNTSDGISLAQVAEGALDEASNMLQRMRELAVQSINATNSPSDRQALQLEAGQLTAELNRVAKTTEFNGQKLFNGTFNTAIFQVGPNANQTIASNTSNFQTDQYGDFRLEGATSSVATTDRLAAAGSFVVNGENGAAVVNYDAGDSAQTVANSVNQATENTGVTAFAKTETSLSFSAAGSYQLQVSADNGATKSVSFSLDSATGIESLNTAVTAFNEQSSTTGVFASVNKDGSGITLTHNTGETINISDTTNANSGNVTVQGATSSLTLTADSVADTAVVTGQVTFDSRSSFSVSGTAGAVTTNLSDTGILQEVAQVDISTVDGSNEALTVIDQALSRVASQRAIYGAMQSRFESTIRNSETSYENLSASRSRIQDADYAKETAELTRAMILKKSGTAMQAHAHLTQQLALNLLGGSR